MCRLIRRDFVSRSLPNPTHSLRYAREIFCLTDHLFIVTNNLTPECVDFIFMWKLSWCNLTLRLSCLMCPLKNGHNLWKSILGVRQGTPFVIVNVAFLNILLAACRVKITGQHRGGIEWTYPGWSPEFTPPLWGKITPLPL